MGSVLIYFYISDMKKLLLLTTLFLALACSKDDDGILDPIVGTWMIDITQSYFDSALQLGDEPKIYTNSFKGGFVYNSNGRGKLIMYSHRIGNLDFIKEGAEPSSSFTWTNIGRDEEDFNKTAQKYKLSFDLIPGLEEFYDELIVDFSYDFKELTIRTTRDDCYLEWTNESMDICTVQPGRKMKKQ